jgi:cellulose biosynthesis protein BcsQ
MVFRSPEAIAKRAPLLSLKIKLSMSCILVVRFTQNKNQQYQLTHHQLSLTVRNKPNRQLQIAGFVPTKYDARNSQDTRTLAAITEQLAIARTVFPPIPRSTAFVDASEERKPLAVYEPKHPSVAILKKIAVSLESLQRNQTAH